MWVKKTTDEIQKTNRDNIRHRVIGSIFIGGVVFFGVTITKGWKSVSIGGKFFASWDEMFFRMPVALFTSIIIGLLFYLIYRERKIVICPGCGKVKYCDNSFECSCGKRFEKLDDMKWED